MTHIGLLEDTELVRELLTELLEDRGHRVTALASISEARDAFFLTPPDLLVTDVGLPDGDGLELVAELRQLHDAHHLPVLVLSGMGTEGDLIRGFDAGASDYITKPVSPAEFLAKCTVLLSRARKAAGELKSQGDDLPGGRQAAFGRYEIEGVLGRGGNGAVFAARDLEQDRRVALKVLSALGGIDEEARKRFVRETYALSQVSHPRIVAVSDFGASEGRLYFAMDLVTGPTVAEKVRQDGRATESEAATLTIAVAGALEALARAGLVHRDVKPENIVLRGGRWDDPVLVDFGLAKHGFDRSLTSAESVIGTPGYMCPEAILGHDVDVRSDLFSLGLVARFVLTGTGVFPERTCLDLLRAIASLPIPIPAVLSAPLRSVLKQMTRIDPSRRFPDTATLIEALTATLDPETRKIARRAISVAP